MTPVYRANQVETKNLTSEQLETIFCHPQKVGNGIFSNVGTKKLTLEQYEIFFPSSESGLLIWAGLASQTSFERFLHSLNSQPK